ncbi:MAG: recombination regulator RecX [Burkholderiaceae bacterium]
MRKPPPEGATGDARWQPSDLQALAAGGGRTPRSSVIGGGRGDEGEQTEGRGHGRKLPPGLSLRGRALRFLSQHEHSRFELARKLGRFEPDADVVASLLDALEREGWLSSERFVESVLHRRSRGFGLRRIRQELAEHRLDGDAIEASLASLRESEFERAWALWRRRFDSPPADLKERARQHRYLAARGFGNDVIAKVLRQAGSDTL